MNIVWVSSEAMPFAKTGGLADVSGALPEALAKRGHKVSVIIPYYPQQMGKLKIKLKVRHSPLGVPMGIKEEWAQIMEYRKNKHLSYFFIESHKYFDRPGVYEWDGAEYSDNPERYIFFSRAAMQTILALNIKPDILHSHDWHTSLCNVYLKSFLYRENENFKSCRSVLTIHNIGYQGLCDKWHINIIGLGWGVFNYFCLEYYDKVNLLKGGIMTADMVNTVSPTYGVEILSKEFGFTLEPSLQNRAAFGRFRGILNGIDASTWNPKKDKYLPANYSKDDLSGKEKCKKALQKEFNLPLNSEVPLIGLVTRLVYQKGIDIFTDIAETMLLTDNVQFIVLGSGETALQDKLKWLADKYPEKMGVFIGFSDRLSHLIEAGADFFLMPSRYEPCGLNQMYSMRYGTLPIVRATGGLEDTVENYEPGKFDVATGFKLWDLDHTSLLNTIRWAMAVFHKHPKHIQMMRTNGMKKDFSWNHTAILYEHLYEDAHRGF